MAWCNQCMPFGLIIEVLSVLMFEVRAASLTVAGDAKENGRRFVLCRERLCDLDDSLID